MNFGVYKVRFALDGVPDFELFDANDFEPFKAVTDLLDRKPKAVVWDVTWFETERSAGQVVMLLTPGI